MAKKTKQISYLTYGVSILVVLVAFMISFFVYDRVPEMMASHWDTQGRVNGYISRFWGLAIMPLVSLFILLLYAIIPKIDPLRANIASFKKYFDGFILVLVLFFFYLHVLTIAWNLQYSFDMTVAIMPAIAVLLFYSGVMMEKSKKNWFIGIRTPWTLSSDRVWEKTHKMGGMLFKITAVLTLFGIAFPGIAVYLLLFPLLATVVFTIVYSYYVYQKR